MNDASQSSLQPYQDVHHRSLQVETLELPCIAHCFAEDHGSLADTLDGETFDYVVITSPEVSVGLTCPRVVGVPLWRAG